MKQNADNKDIDSIARKIARQEKRKLKAQQTNNNVWSGIGMMGMVGWSVVMPTLLGAAAGFWMDKHFPKIFSWTLSLLLVGLITGSIVAWYWVDKENKEMHADKKEEHE